jgi:hypothetical protein
MGGLIEKPEPAEDPGIKFTDAALALLGLLLAFTFSLSLSLMNTLNNVTSAHAALLAAYRERLPWSMSP